MSCCYFLLSSLSSASVPSPTRIRTCLPLPSIPRHHRTLCSGVRSVEERSSFVASHYLAETPLTNECHGSSRPPPPSPRRSVPNVHSSSISPPSVPSRRIGRQLRCLRAGAVSEILVQKSWHVQGARLVRISGLGTRSRYNLRSEGYVPGSVHRLDWSRPVLRIGPGPFHEPD